MLLAEIDKLDLLGPQASVVWRGLPAHCEIKAPSFAIGSGSQRFVEHHRNNHAALPAPAIYAIDDAEIHGLGAVLCDKFLLGGDGWPGLSSLTAPAPRFLGQSAAHYFQNVASGRRRRQIEGSALLLARPGDNIYGHWLLDIFPLVWLTMVCAGLRVRYILRTTPPEYAIAWLQATGASTADFIFYDPEAEILEVERLLVASNLRRGNFLHPEIKKYRDWFEAVAGLESTELRGGDRKICISRRDWAPPRFREFRQLLNREAVEARCLKHGFEIYQPEKQPLYQQIATFRQARLIVGESGSALHNSMFAGSEAVVGVMVAANRLSLIQGSLCTLFGQKIAYATGEPLLRPNYFETFAPVAPYVIAPEVIDQFLDRLETVLEKDRTPERRTTPGAPKPRSRSRNPLCAN
jgi:hypothetical protein